MTTNIPASHLDLLENNDLVILSTIGAKGEPQTTALWFVFIDGQVKMSINDARQKLKNLRQNPHASAFFLDPKNPGRTLELRGTVVIEPDPDYVFAKAVKQKYDFDVAQLDQPGQTRSWVTLHADKVISYGQ